MERIRKCLTNTQGSLGYQYKTVGSRSKMLSRNSDLSLKLSNIVDAVRKQPF